MREAHQKTADIVHAAVAAAVDDAPDDDDAPVAQAAQQPSEELQESLIAPAASCLMAHSVSFNRVPNKIDKKTLVIY